MNNVDAMLQNSKVFNGNIVNTSIDKDTLSQLNMGYSTDGQMTSGYSIAIEKLSGSYKEATAEANALKMAQDGLSKSTANDILAKQNWSKAEREAALNSKAFMAAQASSTVAVSANTTATWANVVATKAMSIAKQAVSIIGGMAFAAAISIGISALVNFVDGLITTKKEIQATAEKSKQSINDMQSAFNELSSGIDNIKERYAELAQGIDQLTGKNLTLSIDDYKDFLDLSNQLAELFPELVIGYDENGNAILDLSGNVNTIVGSLDALIDREKQLLNKQILEEIPEIYAGYKINYDQYNKELDELDKKNEQLKELMGVGYSILDKDESEEVVLHWSFSSDIDNRSIYDMQYQLHNIFKSINEDLTDYIETYVDPKTNEKTFTITIPKVEFDDYGSMESIFGEYMNNVNGDIQLVKANLEKETSDFNKYLYTWLNDTAVYQGMSDELKLAMNNMVFNGDWLAEAFKDPAVDTKSFDSLAKWLEKNYFNTIGKVNNTEIQDKLIELFSMKDPQLKLELAQQLQDYFDKHNIKISLGLILDGSIDGSTQNIVDRFKQSITDMAWGSNGVQYKQDGNEKDNSDAKALKEYTSGFTEPEMEYWLAVTANINNATEAINVHKKSLGSIDEQSTFFSEDNISAIDEYKNNISDLSGYLEKILLDGKLSADDISQLNLEYDILADSLTGYKYAIIEQMDSLTSSSDVMMTLSDAIKSCNDEAEKAKLQSLYNALSLINKEAKDTAASVYNLEESVSTLESSASLLRELDELMQTQGFIDDSMANNILSVFPEMGEKVAMFNAGLISSQELFDLLVLAYQDDESNYAKSIAYKMRYNEEYFDTFVDNLPDWVKNLADAYDIDLINYTNLNEQKLALDKEYLKRKNILDNHTALIQATTEIQANSDTIIGKELAGKINASLQESYIKAQEEFDVINQIINGVEDSFTTNVSWKDFGKNESDPVEEQDKTEIDWADQSLNVLENKVDKFQNALANTKGLKNQLEAIDDLNTSLEDLKNGYESAFKEYSNRYKTSVAPLGKNIRKKIESGESFNLSEYSPEDAEQIQTAIDNYNKMNEAIQKYEETKLQISDNKNLEKSKLRQDDYESQLDTISTKLEDQTLSVKEKNGLLTQQYKLQLKINEELRKQALYNGDLDEVARLDAEDKNNKLQHAVDVYNSNKETRGFYINDAQNEIQDIQNDIEAQGGRGTEVQFANLESLYNTSKEYWLEQKQDAEAMLATCNEGTADWDKWNNEIQECEDNIAKCDTEIKQAHMSILKLPLNEVEDALKEIEKKLEGINESLADQDTYISVALGVLDLEIDSQETLKEAIQDKIDALQEEKELRETNLAVQKAEYELEKAKNQRTNKVFYEGQGWVYEANQDDVNNAQQAYDEAIYNRKIYLLNEQLSVYDKEIERLNDIKETWSNITSQIQFSQDLNKALIYDSEFYTKVLTNDLSILNSISSTYSSLVAQKTAYETQQKDYTTLQDVINETVELYNLEGITFKDAKQRVSEAIKLYYPEIVAQYENEAEVLDRVAEKKLYDAGVTSETSEDVLAKISESNGKIEQSYDTLLTNLTSIVGELTALMNGFANSAQSMASTVKSSISSVTSNLNSLSATDFNVNVNVKNGEVKKAGKSHNGMELGYLGESSTSRNKEAFRYIALDEMDNSELLRLVQKGEAILTPNQVNTVMSNFKNLAQVKAPTLLPYNKPNKSIEFNGDIVINAPVGDSSKLAKEIRQNLGNSILQELYKQ